VREALAAGGASRQTASKWLGAGPARFPSPTAMATDRTEAWTTAHCSAGSRRQRPR